MRRRLILAAAAVAVAIVAALWLFWPQPTQTQPEVASAQTQMAWPLRGLLFGPSLDDPSPNPPADSSSSIVIDVCGAGKTKVTSLHDLPAPLIDPLRDARALKRAVSELAASSAPGDRAIAFHYEATMASRAAAGDDGGRASACFTDDNCRASAFQSIDQAAAPYYQQLAELAGQTGDPLAMSLAFRACRSPEVARTGACTGITAARWAELEPDNGVAWILAANEAASRGDEAARNDAMARAATAQRMDHHAEDLLRPIATASLRDANRLDQMAAFMATMGVYSGAPLLDYAEIGRYCLGKEAMDPSRKAQCAQIAEQLVGKDTTPSGTSYGMRIGARAGWTVERLAALRDEIDAMNFMSIDERFRPETVYSCESLDAITQRASDMLHFGEAGALRRKIARSGRSVAELAREYHEYQRRQAQAETTARQ